MKTGDILYLHAPNGWVMTGHVFKRRRRWWFKCDAMGSHGEQLATLLREGWEIFEP